VNPIKFTGPDLADVTQGGFQNYIGGWSKVLICTWVGGPTDNEVVGSGGHASKSICDLFYQRDTELRFYFEPRGNLKYNIASSNATASQLGVTSTRTRIPPILDFTSRKLTSRFIHTSSTWTSRNTICHTSIFPFIIHSNSTSSVRNQSTHSK
jgi:hypothetical protein